MRQAILSVSGSVRYSQPTVVVALPIVISLQTPVAPPVLRLLVALVNVQDPGKAAFRPPLRDQDRSLHYACIPILPLGWF